MDPRARQVPGVAEKRIPALRPLPSQGGGLATARYAAFAIYAAYAIAWTVISCRVNPHTNINRAVLRRVPVTYGQIRSYDLTASAPYISSGASAAMIV